MRIRKIIESALWIPLLVCLSILAASVDNIPDLPALRQAVIGSRVSQSISPQARTNGAHFATVEQRDEIRCLQPESAICQPLSPLVMGRNFPRHESDSSPPSLTRL
jgi:hypothetical protein